MLVTMHYQELQNHLEPRFPGSPPLKDKVKWPERSPAVVSLYKVSFNDTGLLWVQDVLVLFLMINNNEQQLNHDGADNDSEDSKQLV